MIIIITKINGLEIICDKHLFVLKFCTCPSTCSCPGRVRQSVGLSEEALVHAMQSSRVSAGRRKSGLWFGAPNMAGEIRKRVDEQAVLAALSGAMAAIEIGEIIDPSDPVRKHAPPEQPVYGTFAKADLPAWTVLGEYGGEVKLASVFDAQVLAHQRRLPLMPCPTPHQAAAMIPTAVSRGC